MSQGSFSPLTGELDLTPTGQPPTCGVDGPKGHWSVSRRGPEPGRFFGDPALLARDNILWINLKMRLQKMRPQRGLPEMLQVKNATTRPPGNVYLLIKAKMRPEKNATHRGSHFLAFISY